MCYFPWSNANFLWMRFFYGNLPISSPNVNACFAEIKFVQSCYGQRTEMCWSTLITMGLLSTIDNRGMRGQVSLDNDVTECIKSGIYTRTETEYVNVCKYFLIYFWINAKRAFASFAYEILIGRYS